MMLLAREIAFVHLKGKISREMLTPCTTDRWAIRPPLTHQFKLSGLSAQRHTEDINICIFKDGQCTDAYD